MFSAQRALFGQSCSPLSVLGFYARVPQGWSLSNFPDEVAPSVLRSARLHFKRGLIFHKTKLQVYISSRLEYEPPIKVKSVIAYPYTKCIYGDLCHTSRPNYHYKQQRFPLKGYLASVMHQSIASLFPCLWPSRACWPDGFIQHLSFCWGD
jgi:hypothetical protein